jgi:TRAP transporter TAXI family solute receptor
MGGALMPPVMGTAAFVMADFLGVPLTTLMKRALVPALLFYLGVLTAIFFEARRCNLSATPRKEIPDWKTILPRIYLLSPLAALVLIILLGFSALEAGLGGVLTAAAVILFRYRGRAAAPVLVEAMVTGTKNTVMIAVTIASAGMIVGAVAYSGFAVSIGGTILSLVGQSTPVILAVTMILALLLGLGMPTTAVYILTVSLLAPTLSLLHVDALLAHLFVFYFAILSDISPPVCVASYAAAGLAGTDPLRTGFTGMRIGFGGFLVPFIFMYRPALTLEGSAQSILGVVAIAALAVFASTSALSGWLRGPLRRWEQALLLGGAISLAHPSQFGLVAGLVAIGVCVWSHVVRVAPSAAPAPLAVQDANRPQSLNPGKRDARATRLVTFATPVAVILALSGSMALPKKESVTLIGGGMGGSTYGTLTGFAYIGMKYTDLDLKVIPGGGLQSLIRVGRGGWYGAMGNTPFIDLAARGRPPFDEKYPNVRTVMRPGEGMNLAHFAVTKDVPLEAVSDLAKMKYPLKLAVDRKGTTDNWVLREILSYHGVTTEALESWGGSIREAGYTDQIMLLADGHVDAVFQNIRPPSSTLMEASVSRDMKFLDFSEELVGHMEGLGWRRRTLPLHQYRKVLNERPVTSVGYSLPLIVSAQIPDEIVYEITKALCEHVEETRAVHPSWRAFDPKEAWKDTGGELHPGAARYFREQGYMP